MTVSAQFLVLYSVALVIVSIISTMFFMQTHYMHKRAMSWYGMRFAGLDNRWKSLTDEALDAADAADAVPTSGTDQHTDAFPEIDAGAARRTTDQDPLAYQAIDRGADGVTDVMLRDLVDSLSPDTLVPISGRVPVPRDVDESSDAEPSRVVGHAPRIEPAPVAQDDPTLPPSGTDQAEAQQPGVQPHDAGRRWKSSGYRGRHEAELLIYPTAPFPLVVRNERDGGSRR